VSAAIAELESRLARMTREELLSLTPDEAATIDYTLKDARCAESVASFTSGALYWLTELTATENPQYEAQGVPFKAPFPRKSYFVPLFDAFLKNMTTRRPLFIPKSRTMMTSWAAMGFAVARAQWHKEETIVQTANEDKASHLIDYCRQLWDNQDEFLKQRHPLRRRSTFTLAWEGGGEMSAIPSGPDKIRAFHPSRYIQDEAAFLPDGEECLNAVFPTGAHVICISTARAGWFADECSL